MDEKLKLSIGDEVHLVPTEGVYQAPICATVVKLTMFTATVRENASGKLRSFNLSTRLGRNAWEREFPRYRIEKSNAQST